MMPIGPLMDSFSVSPARLVRIPGLQMKRQDTAMYSFKTRAFVFRKTN